MPNAADHIPKRPLANTLLLLALWIAFYASFTLFHPALLDDADSVHAEVAREMLLRHDYVTALCQRHRRYLEKAPLLYWSMAACMGVSQALGHGSAKCLAVAARIPLAFTVLALAFAVEAFARRAFRNARAGLYAALILLSSPGIFLFTRILLPDAMLCLWLTLAMLCFWQTEEPAEIRAPHSWRSDEWDVQAPRLLCYAFAACCGLGVLTKGLIGAVFPLAIVAIYLLLTRGLRSAVSRIFELHPFSSALVFLAIAAPWHILIAWANPTRGRPGDLAFSLNPAAGAGHWQVPLPTDGNVHGWAWFYFVNEHVLRYLNLRVPRDYDTVPLWLFWGLCLIWLMPWSAFVFKAVANAVALAKSFAFLPIPKPLPARARLPPRRGLHLLLAAIWAAVPLLFFSLSTRQEYYVLPALPAIALLLAEWLAGQKHYPRPLRISAHRLLASFGWAPPPDSGAARSGEFRNAHRTVAVGRRPPWPRRNLRRGLDLVSIAHARARPECRPRHAAAAEPGADYAMSMGHFLDLNAQALGLFRLPLRAGRVSSDGSLLLGPLASAYPPQEGEAPRRKSRASPLVLLASCWPRTLACRPSRRCSAPRSSPTLSRRSSPHNPTRSSSSTRSTSTAAPSASTCCSRATRRLRIGCPVLGSARAGSDPDPIAAKNPLHILTDASYNGTPNYGRSSNLWYGSFFPDAPAIFETSQTLAAKWRGRQRIFLWQDLAGQPSPLPASLSPVYILARSGGKEIVSNQRNRFVNRR